MKSFIIKIFNEIQEIINFRKGEFETLSSFYVFCFISFYYSICRYRMYLNLDYSLGESKLHKIFEKC